MKIDYLLVLNTVVLESNIRIVIFSFFIVIIFEYRYFFKNVICFFKYCVDIYFLKWFLLRICLV